MSVFIFVLVACTATLLYFYVYLTPLKTEENVDYIKITILGAVKSPGSYLVAPNQKLYEVVNVANGLESYALLNIKDLEEIVRPDSTYTIEIDEKRIQKKNLNAIYSFIELKNSLKSFAISESTSKNIIENKRLFGNYKYWTDIEKIKGVGPKTIEHLKRFFFLS